MRGDTHANSKDLINDALHLIEKAQEKNLILRLIGACAIRVHVPLSCPILSVFVNERKLTDIDFATYSRDSPRLDSLFIEEGYVPFTRFNTIHGGKQLRYFERDNSEKFIDVFVDKLEMCHTIYFNKKLEVDYPTIPLAMLLLEKMQIVKINEKDIKDTILLFATHEIGDNDHDLINAKYIAQLLSSDWGFYYTVKTNLNKVQKMLDKYEWVSKKDNTDIRSKIDKLLNIIEREPKSLSWRLRSKIGTKKKWYSEVDEIGG